MHAVRNALLALVSFSIGYVTAQGNPNVQTTLLTEVQGTQTLVLTEVISVVGTQGSTQIVQVKLAAEGMTITESFFTSPSEFVRIEDEDSGAVQLHDILDCKIDQTGNGQCVESVSEAAPGTTLVTVATFVSQFPPPTAAPTSSPSSSKPSPSPASSSKPSSSPNSNPTPSSGQPSPSPSSVPSASSSSSSSSASLSASNSTVPVTTTSGSLNTTASVAAAAPTSSSGAGNGSGGTPGSAAPGSADDSPTTVTAPLPTDTTLNPVQDNGAMVNSRSLGAVVALTSLGMILGII